MARLKAFDTKVMLSTDYTKEDYCREVYLLRQSTKLVNKEYNILSNMYFDRRIHASRDAVSCNVHEYYTESDIIDIRNVLEKRRTSVYALGLAKLYSVIENMPMDTILRDEIFDNIFVKVKAYSKTGDPIWVESHIDEPWSDKVILVTSEKSCARRYSLNQYIQMRTLADITTSKVSVIPNMYKGNGEAKIVPIEIWTTMIPVLELDSEMTAVDASEAERDVIAMLLEQFNVVHTKKVINMSMCLDERVKMANRANDHLVPLLNGEDTSK